MYNILLAGVGGQGTVLASKIIAACAINKGKNAHTAETIGMAQRGGSVVSHVRIGDNVYSPLIPMGQADIIIGFEPGEAVRALPYLKKNGTVIVSNTAIKPITDSLSSSSYNSDEMLDFLRSKNINLVIVDGDSIIKEMGSAKFLNVALLGAAAKTGVVDFSVEDVEKVIKTMLKPQFCEANLKALKLST